MLKRVAILLLILVISMTVSSCSPSSAYGVWEDMCDQYPDQKGKVQVISDGESNYHIEYEGQSYFIDKLNLFSVRDSIPAIHEDDILVGWDSLPFGTWYLDKYYSNTADNPIFIYMSRLPDLYLRSDYKYEADTFILEGTDYSFVFSDMLCRSSDFPYNPFTIYSNQTDITLYSKQYPRLKIQLRLFCVDNTWYVGGGSDAVLFEISDELLNLLNTN